MTFQHRAGVSPYTSACALAETCVFGKQLLGPFHCDLTSVRLPFSLSYGVNLPSSLTRVIPLVCGFSPCLPVSVCGTGVLRLCLAAFLASVKSSASIFFTPGYAHVCSRRVLHYASHSLTTSLLHPRGLTILLCHCITSYDGIGISTDCPSSTPFGLDLGPDLPWADEPSPGNLRLPTAWILTTLSLLMPAFSLVCCPQVLSLLLQPAYIAPLPITLL